MSLIKINLSNYMGFIFDLDGVITDTSTVHAIAWKNLFDTYLTELKAKGVKEDGRVNLGPFDLVNDYRTYVDGKPRCDGVKSFLESRGIYLPWGRHEDLPNKETICGMGNRKNGFFKETVEREGVTTWETSVSLLRQLREQRIKTAVVSSSKNCMLILGKVGLTRMFDAKVDGVDALELNLPGKPDPAMFVLAADKLDLKPSQCVVFEDAAVGVEAGRRGGFGLVIGVDRIKQPQLLLDNGADVVVSDLGEIKLIR